MNNSKTLFSWMKKYIQIMDDFFPVDEIF